MFLIKDAYLFYIAFLCYSGNCISSYASNVEEKEIYWFHLGHLGSSSFITGLDSEVTGYTTSDIEKEFGKAPAPMGGLYYLHGDHLGTATYVTSEYAEPTQFFLNLPFGETMMEQQEPTAYVNPYKFNAKELDSETGLYYYGARYYNPRLSIWYGVDSLAVYNPVMETQFYGDGQHNGGSYFWGNNNPYIYTYQNPVIYIDPNGKQTFGQQVKIAIKNPFKIGLMNRAGGTLADRAGEFSRRGATPSSPFAVLDRNGPVSSDADRGGERGAFRHATWMAFVSSEYGSKNAKWVGDLHEGKSTDTSQTTNIVGIIGADTVADELNNKIGRSYGEKNKGKQSRDIALGILEIYHNEGLYQVEKADGKNTFNVIRKKLSDTKYDALKKRFQGLSNDGVTPKDKDKPNPLSKPTRARL